MNVIICGKSLKDAPQLWHRCTKKESRYKKAYPYIYKVGIDTSNTLSLSFHTTHIKYNIPDNIPLIRRHNSIPTKIPYTKYSQNGGK